MKKKIRVAAAVIVRNDGKILCAKRGNAKNPEAAHKWEFPGGKVEAGETPEAALVREMREEMDFPVVAKRKLIAVEHEYADFAIVLDAFLCVPANAEAQFVLREHADARWLAPDELDALDWAPADVPVVKRLHAAFPRATSSENMFTR